jgi:hypothetical protein
MRNAAAKTSTLRTHHGRRSRREQELLGSGSVLRTVRNDENWEGWRPGLSLAIYASTPCTTLPAVSVRRKSRPW